MEFNGHFEWEKSDAEILTERDLEMGGAVQKYVDSEVVRLCEPYTPFRQGVLIGSAQLFTEFGSGEVVYNTPYARYLYYGKLMVGRAPKTLTDIDLTFAGAPMRGAFWFDRMKADHKENILEGAKRIAGAH